jgi:hypothetical protein
MVRKSYYAKSSMAKTIMTTALFAAARLAPPAIRTQPALDIPREQLMGSHFDI